MVGASVLALVLSCKEEAPPVVLETETTDTADSGEAWADLTGVKGSISLMRVEASVGGAGGRVGLAVFPDGRAQVANWAQCLSNPIPCAARWPSVEGEDVDVFEAAPSFGTLVSAGPEIQVGGASWAEEVSSGNASYFSEAFVWGEATGFAWDGDLTPFQGDDLVRWPTPMTVEAPDPMTAFVFGPDVQEATIRWEEGSTGEVYFWWGGAGRSWVDDGEEVFDLDLLEVMDPFSTHEVVLVRQAEVSFDAAGNPVSVIAASAQPLRFSYENLEGWTELVDGVSAAETCEAALELTPVGAGQYWGSVAGRVDDHDPGQGGITGYRADGEDEVIPVALLTGQRLKVRFRNELDDGSVYLLNDSCRESRAEEGSDATLSREEEEFTFQARVDGTYFIVADTFGPSEARYALVIEITDP
mgnify:CR=1 FL=1